MKHLFKRYISCILVFCLLFSTFSTSVSALSWDGSSSGNNYNGGIHNSSSAFYIKSFNTSNNIFGYRFSVVDVNGNTVTSRARPNGAVDIWLNSNSISDLNSSSKWLDRFSTIYNKTDLIKKQNNSFSTSAHSANSYYYGSLGCSTAMPQDPSKIKNWTLNANNLNPILYQLGINGMSALQPGDKVLVEPIFVVVLNWHDYFLTITEMALIGKAFCGVNSTGSGTGWSYISNYTNNVWPNALYTPDGQGLWPSTSALSSNGTFYELINKGYGVGIAFGVPAYYLDLNGYLDGSNVGSLLNYGTADVYINGNLVANDAADFVRYYGSGTTYSFTDIKPTTGHTYHGAYSGKTSGTITGNTATSLYFTTNRVLLAYNPNGGTVSADGYGYNNYGWITENGETYFDSLKYGESDDPYNDTTFGLTRKGYTFTGWQVYSTGQVLDQNTSYDSTVYADYRSSQNTTANTSEVYCFLYAQWEPNESTYIVKHWQQNLDGIASSHDNKNYTLKESETFTGQIGDKVTPGVKNYTGFTAPKTQTVTIAADGSTVVNYYYTRNSYYLDLNGYLDGVESPNIDGYGTADIYINNKLVADDVSDYRTAWEHGTTYEIKDIKSTTGHTYEGVYYGLLSGVITGQTAVSLKYTTNSLDVNGFLDGKESDNIKGYGTFDVYIEGKLVADDVTDYNEIWDSGTSYEIKDIKSTTGHTYEGVHSGKLKGTISGKTYVTLSFTTNTYTIEFDGNGATGGSMKPMNMTYGESKALTPNKFTKKYFSFINWNTEPDGTGKKYSNGQTVKNLTAKDNDTITLYAQWECDNDLSIEAIEPNSNYRENVTVITAFNVYNDSESGIIPDHNASVKFSVYKGGTRIYSATKSSVVIPGNGKNLVYFKWTVPSGLKNANVTVKADILLDGVTLSNDSMVVATEPINDYQTPDTDYESNKPSGWTLTSAPTTSFGSTSWSEWVYQNDKFVKKNYTVSLSSSDIAIAPDSRIESSMKIANVWQMKSGYGISLNWTPKVISTGSADATNAMYTEAQTAYAMFPEYRYVEGAEQSRLLDNVSGAFCFEKNSDANNERLHFIPLWYPNGTKNYTVSVHGYDCWTPAGMISIKDNTNSISINGSLYDDYFIGRR